MSAKRRNETLCRAEAGRARKTDLLIALLRRQEGATIADMAAATGWQPHSVRGGLSGLKKGRGLFITSEKTEGGRLYRAAPTAEQ